MKCALRYLLAGVAGAILYPLLEILWRGFTHPSMALAGGICSVLLFAVNDRTRQASLLLRAVASALAITFVELCFGVVCNLCLDLNVWDYSEMPGQLSGQICLPYSLLWLAISLPVCFLFGKVSDRFRA